MKSKNYPYRIGDIIKMRNAFGEDFIAMITRYSYVLDGVPYYKVSPLDQLDNGFNYPLDWLRDNTVIVQRANKKIYVEM